MFLRLYTFGAPLCCIRGVNSYPTYKLIDRNGNILGVNADPRDLNALEGLIKMIE